MMTTMQILYRIVIGNVIQQSYVQLTAWRWDGVPVCAKRDKEYKKDIKHTNNNASHSIISFVLHFV